MTKLTIVIFCFILAFVFFACKSEQKSESEMQQQEEVTTVESDTGQATCPACGMTMAQAEMITFEVDGETLHFCSEGCKDHYLAQQQDMEESEESEIEDE